MKQIVKTKAAIGIIVLVAILAIGYFVSKGSSPTSTESIKIGVITPLTGDLAFWGENSRLGVELAKKDLTKEGINVDFIVEDGQLDPKTALNADFKADQDTSQTSNGRTNKKNLANNFIGIDTDNPCYFLIIADSSYHFSEACFV